MIEKLQNKEIEVSKKIHLIFQESYKIEAQLLGVTDFHPLKRSIENYAKSNTIFFGYIKDNEIAGIIEIDYNSKCTHINSLVIAPKYFRQGFAGKLIGFIFQTFDSSLFIVETGLENKPANELYKKIGFKKIKEWDTNHGIRKVKFEYRKTGTFKKDSQK